jgi:hypothetical protein
MKISQLKEKLVEAGQESDVLDNLSKKELEELYQKSINENNNVEDEAILTDDKIILEKPEENNSNVAPEPTDKNWTQYVLGKFDVDEMEGESPRLEGLRRVAELLIGEIVEEGCELVSSPCLDNENRACARAWVVFKTPYSGLKRFEALADACPGNCNPDFAIYPVAMADTRAKGRCFRSALKLKRIIAAEESCVQINPEESQNTTARTGQITAIRLLVDQLNISISSLLDDMEINYKKHPNGAPDLVSLTYSEALIVVKRLNEIRSSKHVPAKLGKKN